MSLRARLLTALALVAVLPVLLLAASVSELVSRSLEAGGRERLNAAASAIDARFGELRRAAEARLAEIVRDDLPQPPADPALVKSEIRFTFRLDESQV